MDTIQTLKIDVVLNGKKAQIGLKQLYKQLKGIEKPVKSINSLFGKMLKVAGFTGFAKMAFDAQRLGRELGLISDKTGIAASKISKMQSAFSATGGDAKALNNVLSNISSGLLRISAGDATMSSKLSAMNISAWDSTGRVKSADSVLGDIAEWSKTQINNGRTLQEVSQYLKDNFGIEQDLANQLVMGREGFAKYQESMAEMVGSLDEEQISNLKSLNVSFSRLKTTIGVLSEKIISGLVPALEFIIDLFQTGFKEAQGVFEELFGSLSDVLGGEDGLNFLFDMFRNLVRGTADAFKILIDMVSLVFAGFRKFGEWIGNLLAWLANKFGWITGSTDDSSIDEKHRKNVEEYIRKNNLSEAEANNLRLKSGFGKKENLFSTEYIPTFPEIRIGENGLERVSGATIVIENETNINANGDVPVDEIRNAVDESNNSLAGKVINASNGGY